MQIEETAVVDIYTFLRIASTLRVYAQAAAVERQIEASRAFVAKLA